MRKVLGALMIVAATASFSPAATAQEALGGAIIGAGAGAAIGGAVSGRGEGAAVGAVIGGVTGASIGAQQERRRVRVYADDGPTYVVREPRRARAEVVVRRPAVRERTCWRNDFGERVCRYR